jgi:hypothetical protein
VVAFSARGDAFGKYPNVQTGAAPTHGVTSGLHVQPLNQTVSLQQGAKRHWAYQSVRCIPLCAVTAARSAQPDLGLGRPLWCIKELRTRQSLHDLPQMVGAISGREPWSRFALGLLFARFAWFRDKLQFLSAAYQMRSSAILGAHFIDQASSLTSITLGLLPVIGDSFRWLMRRQDSASAERASLHGSGRPTWEELPASAATGIGQYDDSLATG